MSGPETIPRPPGAAQDADPGTGATSEASRTFLLAGLVLWGVGAQVAEPLAAVGAIGTALGVGALGLARGRAGLRSWAKRWSGLWAFVLWGVAVTLLAGAFTFSGALARHLDWLLLPFAGAALTRLDVPRRRLLAGWCLGVFVLSALTAGLQHYGLWPDARWWDGVRWTGATLDRVYEEVPGAEGRYMAGGFLFHRLKFAHVGGIVVLWALVLGLRARGRDRVFCLAVAGFGALAVLMFPYARSGFLALLVGAAAVALVDRERRKQSLYAGAGLVVVGLAIFAFHAPLRERMLGALTLQGSGDRYHLWQAGVSAARQHPLTGTGVGRFQAFAFVSPDASDHVRQHRGKAHNQFLSTAAEVGVPGLVLFLYFLQQLLRRMKHGTALGTAGVATFVFWVVLGLAHDPMFHAEVSLAFVFAFGLASGAPAAGLRHPGPGGAGTVLPEALQLRRVGVPLQHAPQRQE